MGRRGELPSRSGPAGTSLLLGFGVLALAALAAVFLLWPRPDQASVVVPAGGPGPLVANPPVVDLGRVPFNQPVSARFELVNTGGQPVRLLGQPVVRTLEGC